MFHMSKQKLIIIATILLDTIGLGIVLPLLPFYVERFTAGALAVTGLFAMYAVCSLLSAPLLGALSDRIGRRPVMLLSIFSSALGWTLFAAADSLWMLFVARAVDGIAAGNIPIAQSYLSDLAKDAKERSHNLGMVGAAFGVGFVVGPAIGAALSKFGYAAPFWAVAFLATLNFLAGLKFLPETNFSRRVKKIQLNPFVQIREAFAAKDRRAYYLAWSFFALAVGAGQSIHALFMRDVLGLSESSASLIFTAMGAVMVVNQGFLLKRFWLKMFKEKSLAVWLFPVSALGFVVSILGGVGVFLLGIFIMMLSQSVLRVSMSSLVSSVAKEDERGEALGVLASIMSLAMAVAPIAAGALFASYPRVPFVFAAALLLAAFIVMRGCCLKDRLEK